MILHVKNAGAKDIQDNQEDINQYDMQELGQQDLNQRRRTASAL